jgi:proliferating cell nuclear antigen
MLKAKIKTQYLMQFFQSASVLSDECRLKINNTEISMKVVDLSNVCMVSSVLKSGAFDVFKASDSEIGLNLEKLVNILKGSKTDYTEIEYLEEENKIKLSSDKLNFKFGLISLDVIRTEPKIPEIEYNSKMTIKGNDLKQVIKIGEKISDILKFTANKDELMLSSSDGITSDMIYTIPTEDMIESSINGDITSNYDLNYLSSIEKNLGDIVHIKIQTDYPVEITSKFADEKGSITYLLAPRIDD